MDVSAIRHDEANKYSALFTAKLPNGLQIAGLNSGTLVDRADVRQSTSTLRIRKIYVSPAQHPRTGRNVCDCELPLSRRRRSHRARNKSARMLEMWQALATGVERIRLRTARKVKRLSPTRSYISGNGIWFDASPNAKQYCTLGGEDFALRR